MKFVPLFLFPFRCVIWQLINMNQKYSINILFTLKKVDLGGWSEVWARKIVGSGKSRIMHSFSESLIDPAYI